MQHVHVRLLEVFPHQFLSVGVSCGMGREKHLLWPVSRVWPHLLRLHRVSETLVHAYAARTRRCGSRNEFSPFCCTMRASCSATTTATSKCSAARSLLRAWWPGASSPFPTGNLTLEQTNCKCLPCLAAHLVVFGRAFLLCTYQ